MSLDVTLSIDGEEVFSANITHNLIDMAEKAVVYHALWRPNEFRIKRASQLIEPLEKGIARMEADPALFRSYDNDGGWGTYDQFLPWLKKYLAACRKWPEADVKVSR
jgi:hypothetical protein